MKAHYSDGKMNAQLLIKVSRKAIYKTLRCKYLL